MFLILIKPCDTSNFMIFYTLFNGRGQNSQKNVVFLKKKMQPWSTCTLLPIKHVFTAPKYSRLWYSINPLTPNFPILGMFFFNHCSWLMQQGTKLLTIQSILYNNMALNYTQTTIILHSIARVDIKKS